MRIEKDVGSRAASQPPDWLPPEAFAHIVAHAPLVAIDLLVQDTQQRLLLGWRNHPPDRKSTRLNSSHVSESRMPSSA